MKTTNTDNTPMIDNNDEQNFKEIENQEETQEKLFPLPDGSGISQEDLLSLTAALKEGVSALKEEIISKSPDGEKAWADLLERIHLEVSRDEMRESMEESNDLIDERISEWDNFSAHMQGKTTEDDPDEAETPARRYMICHSRSDKDSRELMEILKDKELKDFSKYLRLDSSPEADREEKIDMIVSFLEEHPEYYLYQADKPSVRFLRDLAKYGKLSSISEKEANSYVLGALLHGFGLFDVQYETEGDLRKAVIGYTKQADSLLEYSRQISLNSFFREIEHTEDLILGILRLYGGVDIASLFEMYEKWHGADCLRLDREGFERFLFWRMRVRGQLITGTASREENTPGTDYAVCNDIDMVNVMTLQEKYLEGKEYKPYTPEAFKHHMETGEGGLADEWDELGHYLDMKGIEDDDINTFINQSISHVLNGANITWIYAEIAELLSDHGIRPMTNDYAVIWRLAALLSLKSGLPALKGYSRLEFKSFSDAEIKELPLVGSGFSFLEVDRKQEVPYTFYTHLHEMPVPVQEEVAYICALPKDKIAEELKDLQEEKGENIDLLILQIGVLGQNKNYQEFVELAKRAAASTTGSTRKYFNELAEYYKGK